MPVPQVRGVRPNPQKLHAKVLDHDNGCYTVTYKPEVSGQLEISISCDGIAISGSPFTADAVTLTSQIYRDGAPPPGFFWLFAIRELVSNKPCVILAASWWVSGDGQCRDETR